MPMKSTAWGHARVRHGHRAISLIYPKMRTKSLGLAPTCFKHLSQSARNGLNDVIGHEDFDVAGSEIDFAAGMNFQFAEAFLRQIHREVFARLGNKLQAGVGTCRMDAGNGRPQRRMTVGVRVDLELVRADEDLDRLVFHRRMRRNVVGHRGKMDLAVFDPAAEKIDLSEKVHHELGLGIVEDLVGRADLLDAALVHHHHAVGKFQSFFLIVRDEHAGNVNFVVQTAEPAAEFLPNFSVEAPNGSSNSSTFGSMASALASATRCRWPPES